MLSPVWAGYIDFHDFVAVRLTLIKYLLQEYDKTIKKLCNVFYMPRNLIVFILGHLSFSKVITHKNISILFCSVDGSILGLVFEDSKVKVWNLSEKKFAELKTSQAPTSIAVVEVSSSAYIGTKEGLHYQHSLFRGLHVFIAYLKLPPFYQ